MRETERIVDQAIRMFSGSAWHGPAVLEVLAGVDAGMASAHPVPGAHSIWELVSHLIATQAILLRRILGEAAGTDASEFWPSSPSATPAAWAETIDRLSRQEADLEAAIAEFPESRLDDRLTAVGTSAYNNFHGHVQHNAYHVGQIALLKKMLAAKP